MGRSASQTVLVLEVGSTDYRIQRAHKWEVKQHKRQHRLATNSTEQRNMERQRKHRKDNSGRQQQLEKTKRKQEEAAAQFQETREKKSFCGTRVLRWQSLQQEQRHNVRQQLRSSSASVLPFRSDTSCLQPNRGEKSHALPYSRRKVHLQRDVEDHLLGRHLKKDGYAFLNFLTSQ